MLSQCLRNSFIDFHRESIDGIFEAYCLPGPLAVPAARGVIVNEEAGEDGEPVADLRPAGVWELEVEYGWDGEEGVK